MRFGRRRGWCVGAGGSTTGELTEREGAVGRARKGRPGGGKPAEALRLVFGWHRSTGAGGVGGWGVLSFSGRGGRVFWSPKNLGSRTRRWLLRCRCTGSHRGASRDESGGSERGTRAASERECVSSARARPVRPTRLTSGGCGPLEQTSGARASARSTPGVNGRGRGSKRCEAWARIEKAAERRRGLGTRVKPQGPLCRGLGARVLGGVALYSMRSSVGWCGRKRRVTVSTGGFATATAERRAPKQGRHEFIPRPPPFLLHTIAGSDLVLHLAARHDLTQARSGPHPARFEAERRLKRQACRLGRFCAPVSHRSVTRLVRARARDRKSVV